MIPVLLVQWALLARKVLRAIPALLVRKARKELQARQALLARQEPILLALEFKSAVGYSLLQMPARPTNYKASV